MVPKPKPVELPPNAGLPGVPKLVAVVVAAAPNAKGDEVGAGALDPKVKGFGGAAVELKADGAVDGSKADFPKGNVDCVVDGVAVVVAAAVVLARAKPPKVVGF